MLGAGDETSISTKLMRAAADEIELLSGLIYQQIMGESDAREEAFRVWQECRQLADSVLNLVDAHVKDGEYYKPEIDEVVQERANAILKNQAPQREPGEDE